MLGSYKYKKDIIKIQNIIKDIIKIYNIGYYKNI